MFLFDVIALLGGLLIASFGAWVAFSPVETLLKSDSQTGQAIFRRELERSGDRPRALRAAERFYQVFGGFLMIFGVTLTVASLIGVVG